MHQIGAANQPSTQTIEADATGRQDMKWVEACMHCTGGYCRGSLLHMATLACCSRTLHVSCQAGPCLHASSSCTCMQNCCSRATSYSTAAAAVASSQPTTQHKSGTRFQPTTPVTAPAAFCTAWSIHHTALAARKASEFLINPHPPHPSSFQKPDMSPSPPDCTDQAEMHWFG